MGCCHILWWFNWFDTPTFLDDRHLNSGWNCDWSVIGTITVEKLQFSFFLIYCCPEIFYSSWLSWYLLLKIACLHVSFTAYENFYKLSQMHCLLVWFSTLQPSEVSENRDPTIKHISTYTLISSSISTYVIDLFLVILFT